MSKKPVVLMVLDGYGLSDQTGGNAIAMANTPNSRCLVPLNFAGEISRILREAK